MKLIVGLGNPGAQYQKTRHNAGFMVIDRLAARHAAGAGKAQFHGQTWQTTIAGQSAMLIKPMTYMNLSGTAVSEAASFFKLPPIDLMVVLDETALPIGTLRMRGGGSAGGHNGLADVQRRIGTDQIPRLRIGVGAPEIDGRKIAQRDYVLSPFAPHELERVDRTIEQAADAVECWISDRLSAAMNRFNTPRAAEEKS